MKRLFKRPYLRPENDISQYNYLGFRSSKFSTEEDVTYLHHLISTSPEMIGGSSEEHSPYSSLDSTNSFLKFGDKEKKAKQASKNKKNQVLEHPEERKITWNELIYDVIFVGGITKLRKESPHLLYHCYWILIILIIIITFLLLRSRSSVGYNIQTCTGQVLTLAGLGWIGWRDYAALFFPIWWCWFQVY